MQQMADFFAQAQACLEAVVRPYRAKILAAQGQVAHELKDDKSAVTALDRELEALIREALLKLDSGIGIEGEELGKEGSEETFWLVDPIDGTENFIRGLPFVFNMATLIDHGEPVFAFVYSVVSDELYTASKGGGSFCNGQAIHVAQRPLERAWIELTASKLDEPGVAALIAAIEPLIYRIRRIDDFAYVADGRIDGHIVSKSGGKIWDYAPRALLIAEAGGRVANFGSETYDYKNLQFLATSPQIFEPLQRAIERLPNKGLVV